MNNEIRCGYGILRNNLGQEIYKGDWQDDQFHGTGTLFNHYSEQLNDKFDYRNFDELQNYWTNYEGEFKCGLMNGYGTLVLSNGERLVGNFINDKVNGQATF